MNDVPVRQSAAPLLNLNFLSHGTIESRDLVLSRKFYEECLGLQVVRTSNISLLIKLGGDNTIAVVQDAGRVQQGAGAIRARAAHHAGGLGP